MSSEYWQAEAQKDLSKNADGTTNVAFLQASLSNKAALVHRHATYLKERAKELGVKTMEELKQKEKDLKAEYAAKKERERYAVQQARWAQMRAEQEKRQFGHVKTDDLLGLNEKKEKDLLTFPSREKELEGLFKGGRGKKSRKGKSKKSRKTRRRA